ncbi:MAG: hypothetical protein IKA17_00685 [Clostridia bacterium]|nr:hypothetical protein [Clostridia bacterium]
MFLRNLIKNYIMALKNLSVFTPFGFHNALAFAKKEAEIFKKLVNDPCEVNAIEYIEHRKNKPAFSFTYVNQPSVWESLREKWNIINKSNRISYEMKKTIMDDLIGQGLHLNNQKIIDNYTEDSSVR